MSRHASPRGGFLFQVKNCTILWNRQRAHVSLSHCQRYRKLESLHHEICCGGSCSRLRSQLHSARRTTGDRMAA